MLKVPAAIVEQLEEQVASLRAEVERLRSRVAELEAFRENSNYNARQQAERIAELEAGTFSRSDLLRIIERVSRKPRNGQDIRIEAKARSALRGEPEGGNDS